MPTYRLGNLVWEDYNNDGVADDGEPGIAGVLVQLLDHNGDVIAETVTDVDGMYLFTGLDAGEYQVTIPGDQTPDLADPQPDIVARALDGLNTSGTPNGADDEDDNDNNGVVFGADFTSGLIELGEGTGNEEPTGEELREGEGTSDEDGTLRDDRSELTVDFGFFRGLRLGNQIFLDGMAGDPGYANGTFDDGELGIGGVDVELWEDDGDGVFDPLSDTLVDTVTTDSDGNYAFENLEPGTPYFVAVDDIPNMGFATPGLPNPNAATAADNDNDGAAVGDYASVSSPVTLAIGGTSTSELDENPNPDDLAEDEANAAGNFYPDDNSELRVDLGFVELPLYRIGNLVWDDVDNDGIAEDGEAGINGVTVELLNADGDVIAVTTTATSPVTGADGWYEFPALQAGDYFVAIPMDQPVLAGKASSDNGEELVANDDGDNNDNGLINGDKWVSSVVMVGDPALTDPLLFGTEPDDEELRRGDGTDDDENAGTYLDDRSNYSVDFGFLDIPTYEIGNLVWVDKDDDGVADPDEPGIGGVELELRDGKRRRRRHDDHEPRRLLPVHRPAGW